MNHFTAGPAVTRDKFTEVPANDGANVKINVYVWDMDETLILLKSLLNGTYAAAFGGAKNIDKGIEIGKGWETQILQVCDEFFFYEQIENYNEPCIDFVMKYDDGIDLSEYDFDTDGFGPPHDDVNKRRLAYRHRVIAQKYAQGLHNILDEERISQWKDLYDVTDGYTDRWLSSARALLKQVSEQSSSGLAAVQNINVLVTSGSLVPSLVKCLLFKLDDLIDVRNIYSSWEVGKLQCFSWIQQRFCGPQVQFCVIGDGFEECDAAESMRWPFIRIDARPDGFHRFPGLTLEKIKHYMEVIFGAPNSDDMD